jgi:hypothetical protein
MRWLVLAAALALAAPASATEFGSIFQRKPGPGSPVQLVCVAPAVLAQDTGDTEIACKTSLPAGVSVPLADTATLLATDPGDCAAGEFAHTIAQNGALFCAQPIRTACVAVENVTSATNKPFWIAPDTGATITAIRCNYFDSCATAPTVVPENQAGTDIGPSSYACVAGTIGGAWTAIASSNTLAAREILFIDVTNTPTATCDMLVCVQYEL